MNNTIQNLKIRNSINIGLIPLSNYLKENNNLKKLSFCVNNHTNIQYFCSILSQNTNLISLHIVSTNNYVFEYLSKALCNNNTLQKLKIHCNLNNITFLIDIINNNKSLKYIHVYKHYFNNIIGCVKTQELLSALENNVSLEIFDGDIDVGDIMSDEQKSARRARMMTKSSNKVN